MMTTFHMTDRQQAVSEVLAAAIVCDDETAAGVLCGVAEHLARGFTPDEMSETKAHAVTLVLALGDVPEPGPVDNPESVARWANSDIPPADWSPYDAGEKWDDDY